jgi:hypothetical protein
VSTRARNAVGIERSQEDREAIRTLMRDHMRYSPLRKPLSGKQIRPHLPHLALSTILWHMAAIHAEAEAEASRDPILESF